MMTAVAMTALLALAKQQSTAPSFLFILGDGTHPTLPSPTFFHDRQRLQVVERKRGFVDFGTSLNPQKSRTHGHTPTRTLPADLSFIRLMHPFPTGTHTLDHPRARTIWIDRTQSESRDFDRTGIDISLMT